jgi:hypothetical protein
MRYFRIDECIRFSWSKLVCEYKTKKMKIYIDEFFSLTLRGGINF